MTITINQRRTKGLQIRVHTVKHTTNPIHQATCATCWQALCNQIVNGAY